jgi:mRNA interferase MazF
VSRRVPDRGEVCWLEFDPQSGHEQRGRRPALVLSPKLYNGKVGLAICCPLTAQVKGYPFEVLVPEGLAAKGAVLADQVKSLDWKARKARFLCRLPDGVTDDVLLKVGLLLGR